MYPISPSCQNVLSVEYTRNRRIVWHGTITTKTGTKHDFDTSIGGIGSGRITRECNLPFVGGAYGASLQMDLRLENVDPQTLKDANVEVYVSILYEVAAESEPTWGSWSRFAWGDLSSCSWESSPRYIVSEIPMGEFYVTDAKRLFHSIKLVAYDAMQKFNVDLPKMTDTSRTPYGWLNWACKACGVPLGMTARQVKSMINGERSFVYAAVDNQVKTYRNLISHLAAVLGSVAVIDRKGNLILVTVGSDPITEITEKERFFSEFEDMQSRYTGMWAQYKTQALQEYYKNVSAPEEAGQAVDLDTGLVLDLGANPFLQMSNTSSRAVALQEIIDSQTDLKFTPCNVSIPCHPEFDLLDMIAYSGAHAPENCQAPITSITYTIGGGVTIACAMPEEQKSPVRETIQVDGLSGSNGTTYANSDFWIQIASGPTAKKVISGETAVDELTVNCTVDNTTMQIAWTGCYTLDAPARVTAKVYVDDNLIYEVSDDQTTGSHVLNITCGHEVIVQGERVIKITLQEKSL